jgi:phenylacetate-coenzyme A ligase PaaK-like adenylate-forming protein
MNDLLHKAYYSLPPPLRSMAASLRGLYLNYWRYGRETDRLVDEAINRDNWIPHKWKTWHEERLAYVLHRSATQVPYYREQWAARRRRGDKAPWDCLENWPILEKNAVRDNPNAFVADDCNVRRMFREHTSGTTGKPLSLWWTMETVRKLYALSEARIRYWNGVSRRDRWAMIGGQLVTPVSQRQPPFWVWNMGLKQLYMSSYHLAPDLIASYLEAISSYRVTYLYGYTSSLYALAQGALEAGKQDIRMAVAIANAEPVYDYQRATISQAFNCQLRETYGMAEITAMASECSAGRLHLWPEVGWVEVIQDGQSSPIGESGDLVCTGLLNADMPLIRYRNGDRGALASGSEACKCGRTLPVMRTVEGRIDDILYTSDGRSVGRLDPIFKGNLPIYEAQIIQEALDCVRVRYVPAPTFKLNHQSVITERLQERMGKVKVLLEPVTEVPREPNGKFRAVVSRLSQETRKSLSM